MSEFFISYVCYKFSVADWKNIIGIELSVTSIIFPFISFIFYAAAGNSNSC